MFLQKKCLEDLVKQSNLHDDPSWVSNCSTENENRKAGIKFLKQSGKRACLGEVEKLLRTVIGSVEVNQIMKDIGHTLTFKLSSCDIKSMTKGKFKICLRSL